MVLHLKCSVSLKIFVQANAEIGRKMVSGLELRFPALSVGTCIYVYHFNGVVYIQYTAFPVKIRDVLSTNQSSSCHEIQLCLSIIVD